jgi:hypothetical protein
LLRYLSNININDDIYILNKLRWAFSKLSHIGRLMGLEQPPPPYPELENNPPLILAPLNRIYTDLVNLVNKIFPIISSCDVGC